MMVPGLFYLCEILWPHKAHARAVSEYKRGSFVGQFMLKS